MNEDVSLAEFRRLLEQNRSGAPVGVCSVCSAHPVAIRAALATARSRDSLVLIEATANQVNHLGGYTGMGPADFRRLVTHLAGELGLPSERVLLGGDHLGTFTWHKMPAKECLGRAGETVRAYVASGFEKIHLDVSMYLGDDIVVPGRPLDPEIVARRTAELCRIAEETWEREHGSTARERPVYVVGNEVPVPGGTSIEEGELAPSSVESVRESYDALRRAFHRNGLERAWERVSAVVVQPGVEFGDNLISEYQPERAHELVALIGGLPGIVYEAHSTDYQPESKLTQLVRDHFAILKVGPALTFAYREAIQSLDSIDHELSPPQIRAHVIETVVAQMRREPKHWKSYYRGTEAEISLALAFSFSDRIRYYWPSPPAQASVAQLYDNLSDREIPLPLVSQFFPREYDRVRSGECAATASSLLAAHVTSVIEAYQRACSGAGTENPRR